MMFNKKLMIALSCCILSSSFAYADNAPPTLDDSGVHGITQETVFDVKGIQVLFPKDKVEMTKFISEGQEFPVILISRGNQPLMTLLPTATEKKPEHVLCLAFDSNRVTNTLGVIVGDTFQSIYRNETKLNCIPGMEESSGEVVCKAPNANNIYYLFHGKWDGVDGVVPPRAILNKWAVKQIIWIADVAKKDILAQFCRAETVLASGADSSEPLASEKVEAYNANVDAGLLVKLKNNSPLTLEDKARLEVLYQAKYSGEEALNATQEQIATYAKSILSDAVKKQLEQKVNSQGM